MGWRVVVVAAVVDAADAAAAEVMIVVARWLMIVKVRMHEVVQRM